MNTNISFSYTRNIDFKKVLNQRVNAYFLLSGKSRHHNPAMIFKTVVMLALYIGPFALILTNLFPVWANMIWFVVMGIGAAGVGMSVMHDGNHAAYSGNQKVNRLMGLTMNMLGADAYNWKIKHNKLHHVFTNIYGKDEDINSRVILRFAYAAPLKKYHRYQFIYAWIFYALMSLSMVFGDVAKRFDYRRRGLTNIPRSTFYRSIIWLVLAKIAYFGIFFSLPILLTSLLWWQVLLGFLLMHLTTGTILSLVFQMSHVVEKPQQVRPDKQGRISSSLIAHQLEATADFSRGNKLLSWYVGGLNYQVEHHLFPRICHIHYPALSRIVEATTREYNLPYYVYNTFGEAFASHFRTLKKLGHEKQPMVQP